MDELEARLRQFQPRRPGRLPDVSNQRQGHPARWLLIPALALAVMVVAMVGTRVRAPAVQHAETLGTLGALNAHAMTSDEDLDRMLAATSRELLPDVEHSGGILHALSKE